MTKYTFSPKNNPSTSYCPFYKSTDYSKVLDDLINADIAEKNPWLGATTNSSYNNGVKINIKTKNTNNFLGEIHSILNAKDEYDEAIEALDNYNFYNLGNLYKMKTLYYLTNGTPFMILEDGILIGSKMFFYDDLNNNIFFSGLTNKMKKTIATIYIDGLKITIKK